MNWAIDGVLVLIVAVSAWRGWRNGFIRGILGLLALVVSIYGANLVATAYSGEFTGMLEPFVGGVVDKAVSGVINPEDDTEPAQTDEAPQDDIQPDDGREIDNLENDVQEGEVPADGTNSVYDVSYNALRKIGISEEAARMVAEKVGGEVDTFGQSLSDTITKKLCQVLAYLAVFIIVFVLISIIFAVIGNIFNLAFSIPGIDLANRLIGLVMGLAIGLVIVFVLALAFRYLGLLSAGAIEKTVILNYLLNRNPIAAILGV